MSKNQKKNTKASKNTKKQPEIKSKKNIIIAAAAVAAVAVIVLLAVFVIKPAISRNDNGEATTVPLVTLKNEGTQYTYAEYKGSKLPVEFVEILNQAALDSQAACEKYGVAMTVGDRKISMPEFLVYYFDEFCTQMEEINYSISETGINRTGFETDVMPEDQKHLDDSYTWAEEFTQRAIEDIIYYYEGFDMAIAAKTELDVITITSVISYNDTIDDYAQKEGITPEEVVETSYCEGVTPAMYKARSIMSAYAQLYEYNKKQELYNGYTQEELEKKLNEDKSAYTVVKGRVYPIEGEYEASELLDIKTEQDFLDFASKNFPEEKYNAEIRTQCYFVGKEDVSSAFGSDVGNWMFDESRKPGEITVVPGMLFDYLVYIEEPAHFSTSRDVIVYSTEYDETMTEEQKAKAWEDAQSFLKEWEAGEATQESFEKMSSSSGLGEKVTTRIGDYYYVFGNWIFDSSRKSGDTVALNSDVGCGVIYFIGNNADDYDWPVNMRTKESEADYKAFYDETVKKDYRVVRNDDYIEAAYKRTNSLIENYNEKYAEQ